MVKYNVCFIRRTSIHKARNLELNDNQTKSKPNILHNIITIIRFTIASVVTPESVSVLK